MQAPLAELHLHLEGAIEPATLAEIDPALTPEMVEQQYRFTSFSGFLAAYKWTVERLQHPDHYRLVARRLRERLAREGITHAEVNVSVGIMHWRKQNAAAMIQAIREELPKAPLIFDAVRQHGGAAAVAVAELAAEFHAGFGIGGDEQSAPMSEFATAIRLAGGRFYPHAGETSDAQNVWEALAFAPRRIGHGIRAADDPALCWELRKRDIPLEVCLSSNVATGAVASLAAHPLRRLFDAGVPIVLATDDPAIFRTSLHREFELARHLGFSDRELEILRQNAFQYSSDRWSRRTSSAE